ncbi:MAG: hypothetical protein JW751_10295 [Polyangiaceae bacterium]|nr:hypothetical protein [Polyangiaceae bacterium]
MTAPVGLPEYQPEDAALLDDTFGPDVFPTSVLVLPSSYEKLVERVVRAESVLPVTVTTVSRQGIPPRQSYSLVVTPTGRPLAGAAWSSPLVLTLSPTSPSYAQVVSAETTLVGTPLILLFRRYVADEVESLHWRAEPDTPAVRAAILRATGVRAGRGPNGPR